MASAAAPAPSRPRGGRNRGTPLRLRSPSSRSRNRVVTCGGGQSYTCVSPEGIQVTLTAHVEDVDADALSVIWNIDGRDRFTQQVAAGEVQYVIIHVGGNDFHIWNGTYQEVYSGSLSGARLQAKINSIVANITTAVDTLQQAGEVKIVLANYNDPGQAYEFQRAFPDPAKRQRVTNAILAINQGLSELAVSRNVVLADWYSFGTSLLSRIDANGNLVVGGELIDATTHGDEPHHLQLRIMN